MLLTKRVRTADEIGSAKHKVYEDLHAYTNDFALWKETLVRVLCYEQQTVTCSAIYPINTCN